MLTTTIIISYPFRHTVMPIDLLPRFKTRESKHGISGRRIVTVAETHCDETCFSDVDAIKRGLEDDDRCVQVYVQEDYAIYGQDKGRVSNTRVTTNLVTLPPDGDTDVVSGPQPFITNLAVSDELRIERRETTRKSNVMITERPSRIITHRSRSVAWRHQRPSKSDGSILPSLA